MGMNGQEKVDQADLLLGRLVPLVLLHLLVGPVVLDQLGERRLRKALLVHVASLLDVLSQVVELTCVPVRKEKDVVE